MRFSFRKKYDKIRFMKERYAIGRRFRNIKHRAAYGIMCAVLFVVISGVLTGCGNKAREEGGGLRIVFTTGFDKDTLFRIDTATGTRQEMLLYLVNAYNRYEQSLGDGILSREAEGLLIEDVVRESCLREAAQIKAMNLLAQQKGIVLEQAELTRAHDAAMAYYATLTEADRAVLPGVEVETVEDLYRELALAQKLYQYTIRDINPEVSDDEARTITLTQICVLKGQQPEEARGKIEEAHRRILQGESFESLCSEYNEAAQERISFGKNEAERALEEAAFALATEEVSSVIETDDAFYLLKCVSTFDKAKTQSNKEKIVREREQEAFSRQYDAFAANLPVELNERLWEEMRIPPGSGATTTDFISFFENF